MAEDHHVVRQGIIALLKQIDGFEVLFDVSNGKELLESMKTQLPDIVLLDIDMPEMDGWEAIEQISHLYHNVKVIMLSMHFTEEIVVGFIAKGAKSFLPKESDIEDIIKAIKGVYQFGYHYNERIAAMLESNIVRARQQSKSNVIYLDLTKRELEVLNLLQQQKSNSEIARILNISIRTLEGHRQHILQKAGVKTLDALLKLNIQFN